MFLLTSCVADRFQLNAFKRYKKAWTDASVYETCIKSIRVRVLFRTKVSRGRIIRQPGIRKRGKKPSVHGGVCASLPRICCSADDSLDLLRRIWPTSLSSERYFSWEIRSYVILYHLGWRVTKVERDVTGAVFYTFTLLYTWSYLVHVLNIIFDERKSSKVFLWSHTITIRACELYASAIHRMSFWSSMSFV